VSAAPEHERADWGSLAWLVTPERSGVRAFCSCEVHVDAGAGHGSHVHPRQDEMIYVLAGEIEQTIEHQTFAVGPGESVLIPRGVRHASFNRGDTVARTVVVLAPAVEEPNGYESIEAA
jgi:oxalate decarboxylase/phosphoglucose isomerase-like protein (cupin superfamily)